VLSVSLCSDGACSRGKFDSSVSHPALHPPSSLRESSPRTSHFPLFRFPFLFLIPCFLCRSLFCSLHLTTQTSGDLEMSASFTGPSLTKPVKALTHPTTR
jgi:hypothetical protein